MMPLIIEDELFQKGLIIKNNPVDLEEEDKRELLHLSFLA
jgi:hypothetical protein